MKRRSIVVLVVLAVLLGLAVLYLFGRGASVANRDPTGERFPSVVGESLEGERVAIPEDFQGKPVLLLVGYLQNAQFDADRWILGAMQAGLEVELREVPTIDGMVPGLIANTIDEGMRGGIPKEDWGAVVTVYDDADKIVAFTGNEQGNNMRVLLLDAEGRVRWFHDRGYSAARLLDLKRALAEL